MILKTGLRFCLPLVVFLCMFAVAGAQTEPSPATKSKEEKKAAKKEKIDKMIKQEEEGALIYQKQSLFGIKFYSDGWGVLFEKGYMQTVNKTNLFSIEIGERKAHKEEKVSKVYSGTPFLGNPLIYGKQNNFYFLKLGFGQNFLLGGKGNRNGVAVSALYSAGASVGFLKPYFLDVVDPNTSVLKSIRYLGDGSRNDSLFLDPYAIQGGSGVFKGFDKLKVKPGLFLKGALRFDYGRYNEFISAVETGFNVEYYFADMPIMVDNPAHKSFLNVFVALEFGRRK